ncbi:hypothetical protein B0I37DRAFT_381046 [Chaetomium sp. MPI-CAGE-AT-0009]|nr:hypothetical protein B0I37DRAFT_381046 [Chaetomium sp. MPI-CAGE-AT-0009]
MYASSGLRASIDHWVLDWALVKLSPTRFACEQLCNNPLPSSGEMFESNLDTEGWEETDWIPRAKYQAATTAAASEQGSYLFKVGRTTGHTVGRLHDVDASITIHYRLPDADGSQRSLVKGKALVVRPGGSDGRFAGCGDSGALVLNGHAEAVGMVTAVSTSSVAYGVAYLSPFVPIVDSIKEVLQRGPGDERVQVELL